MKDVKRFLLFVYENRRMIGTVVGSTLVLCGYVEQGKFVIHAGEQ